MLKLSNKSATTLRVAQRLLAAGMATTTPRVGDTKVPMSLLEKDAYIKLPAH
jgi:aconitate hydratase